MPHLIIEYSANLTTDIDINGLVDALHECAVSLDALPTAGIRARAVRFDHFKVGDGNPRNGFINVILRIVKGRSLALRKEIGQELFGVVTRYVQEIYEKQPMSLSFEIQEIYPETRWNEGNIREYMAQREESKKSE